MQLPRAIVLYALRKWLIKMKKRRKFLSKGISPLIATVLIIGFVVSVTALGFMWGSDFIKKRASKEIAIGEKQFSCTEVAITVREAVKTGGSLLVTLENKKDAKIDKITFRVISGDDAENIDSYDVLNGMEIKRYEVNVANIVSGSISQVDIIPYVKVAKSRYAMCAEQHVLAVVS